MGRRILNEDGRDGYRMDERDMEKEGQKEKRKGWGIEMIFF
jgi:hypothetical protein